MCVRERERECVCVRERERKREKERERERVRARESEREREGARGHLVPCLPTNLALALPAILPRRVAVPRLVRLLKEHRARAADKHRALDPLLQVLQLNVSCASDC